MIIDEAGIERLEHLLAPLLLGVNQTVTPLSNTSNTSVYHSIDNIVELASRCGIVATVVGDPKQSRPMGLAEHDRSAIEWALKYAKSDTLRITHRLPDKLSGLVDEFAQYRGLKSARDIASRRLILDRPAEVEYRQIIQPEEVITWVDIDGEEKDLGPTSWGNDLEARTCAKICRQLKLVTKKSIAVVTRFTEQRRLIKKYLQRMGINDIKVNTTTGALGTEADVVLFSLVRNNQERIVGAAGTLQDVNVAISRSREKLIILGNHDMMLNGWSRPSEGSNYEYKSPARRLAKLIDSKYGKLIDSSSVICQ
jgi:superfamily I DNA and/or RNA helicase